jgi:hypothetical protein
MLAITRAALRLAAMPSRILQDQDRTGPQLGPLPISILPDSTLQRSAL